MYTEKEVAYVAEEPTEHGIVFNSGTPDSALPSVGTIIQMPMSKQTPYGFLGRVVSVEKGENITVTTEEVPLDEAYPNLSLDVDLTKIDNVIGLFDEDGNPVEYAIEDIDDITSDEEGAEAKSRHAKSEDDEYNKVTEFDWEKKKLKIPVPESWVKAFTKENIDISGYIELSFEGSDLKVDNKDFTKYIDIDIKPRVTVGAKITGHIKQYGKDGKKEWPTPKLTFKGAIPVGGIIFPITVPIWLKAQLEGDFTTSVSLQYTKNWRLHYVYKDGKWSRPEEGERIVPEDKNPWFIGEFEAGGKFSVGPDLEVNIGVFTSKAGIGMEFYPHGYLKAEASLSSLDPFKLNPEAEVGVGMEWRAYCRAELFGKKVEPFSINLPEVSFWKKTLSIFPNVSEFKAVGSSLSADLSWQSDSYYLLEPLGVKTGATLFKSDGKTEVNSYFPPATRTDRKGQRHYNASATGLQAGTTYYAAPTISWLKWKWHGDKTIIETEANYHLDFRCVNQSYDVISFDFNLNDKSGNVIDYTTDATDYSGDPMKVHITATFNESNHTLDGVFDFFFYNYPEQQRKDGFSISLTDDSGYVNCTKIIDNNGCYAALRIYNTSSSSAVKRKFPHVKPDTDCVNCSTLGNYNKLIK